MADEGFLTNFRQGDIGGLGQNLWEGARDEWLGIDDFGRFARYLRQGDFRKAAKSLGAGVLELGGTALMFVPGGQIAALSKAPKAGKAVKVLELLRPLSLQERNVARLASANKLRRNLFSAAKFPEQAPNLIGQTITAPVPRKGISGLLKNMSDEFGYGRGGILGSLARGAGQIIGQFPTSQGQLASGMFRGRVRLPYVSGKLGALAQRTGAMDRLTSGARAAIPVSDNSYARVLAQQELDQQMRMAQRRELLKGMTYGGGISNTLDEHEVYDIVLKLVAEGYPVDEAVRAAIRG